MTHCNSLRGLLPTLATILVMTLAMILAGCAAHRTHPTTATTSQGAAASKPQMNPKGDPQERFAAALKLMKTHQDKQAIDAFTKLNADFPQYSGPLTDLGILHARHKQWRQAVQSFQKAVVANPKNAVAYDWMGIAWRNLGDYPHAAHAYQQALKLQPDDANAHFNLAVLYDVYLHRPAQALSEYRAYRALGHKDLIVAAWIKGLEQQQPQSKAPSASNHAPASTPATDSPSDAGPKAAKDES